MCVWLCIVERKADLALWICMSCHSGTIYIAPSSDFHYYYVALLVCSPTGVKNQVTFDVDIVNTDSSWSVHQFSWDDQGILFSLETFFFYF